MSDFVKDVLRTMRVFGPCSNAEVARRMREPLHRTYKAIGLLVSEGYAVHPKLQVWDITAKGRLLFGELPTKKLALFEVES